MFLSHQLKSEKGCYRFRYRFRYRYQYLSKKKYFCQSPASMNFDGLERVNTASVTSKWRR